MKGETVGGWTWWVRTYKLAHPDAVLDYKELMKQYIKGEKPE